MGKQNSDNLSIDVTEFYRIINDYILYSKQGEKKFVKKEDGQEETAEEKKKRQAENEKLREMKKTTAEKMDKVYQLINEGGIDVLRNYADVMIEMRKQKELTKAVKDILVQAQSLDCFKSKRKQMDKMIPILVDINDAFGNAILAYSAISLDPVAALYGAEFILSKEEKKYAPPLKADVIFSIVDELSKQDEIRCGKWIFAIISFDPDKMLAQYAQNVDRLADLNSLYKKIIEKINKSKDYQQALLTNLLQDKELYRLIDDQRSFHKISKAHKADTEKIQEMEKKFADGEARREKQYELIVEKDDTISKLSEKIGRFQGLAERLDTAIRKYNLQVSMNETLTEEKNRTLDELRGRLMDALSNLKQLTEQVDQLKSQKEALEVDISLKNNELDRLNANMAQREEQVKYDILKKLVTGINENMYYLSMCYMELEETGNLYDVSMFGDTLKQIKEAFAASDIYQLGTIDEIVPYNSAVHNVTDRSAANGDKVKVTGYGWKIGDEIFIKVPVEKGE